MFIWREAWNGELGMSGRAGRMISLSRFTMSVTGWNFAQMRSLLSLWYVNMH
jgi:hypothetical protein